MSFWGIHYGAVLSQTTGLKARSDARDAGRRCPKSVSKNVEMAALWDHEVIFDHCQSSANARLVAKHDKKNGMKYNAVASATTSSWHHDFCQQNAHHLDSIVCSCTRDIKKASRQGHQGERCSPLTSVISTRPARRDVYATFHSYKQVTEAQTSRILPYLPSLKDTETVELFCDGSRIDGEHHSPVNRKPHQVYNRGTVDVHTFSSPGTNGLSQIGHCWPSHITVLQIA